MFTIKHAARRVGIPAATLRAWERRYGIVVPERTSGGYRVYTEADVRSVSTMKQLVDEGWPASLAAHEAQRRTRATTAGAATTDPTSEVFDSTGPDSPGSDSPAADSTENLTDELVGAASRLDATGLSDVLDRMFASGSFEAVMHQRLFPALYALGEAWAQGRVGVAGEHLASHAVMRRLAAAYEAAAVAGAGPRVLLGMAPGRRHELGLFSFAVAARRRGLDTEYLGSDLPVDDWVAAGTRPHVAAVVLALAGPDDITPTAEVVAALRARRPDLLIAAGGAEQAQAPDGVLLLGHDIDVAASYLARSLATARPLAAH